MSRIVCDHLVPEDQRCLECDKEAAEWHQDTRRILELEARVLERDRTIARDRENAVAVHAKLQTECNDLARIVHDYRRLLGRCNTELLSILADINADQIPHDGDDFHELLRDLGAALSIPK